MRRRRKRYGFGTEPKGPRITLGSDYHQALQKIQKLNDLVAAATVPFPHSLQEVLTWLVPQETRDVLRAAYMHTYGPTRRNLYSLDNRTHLAVDFDRASSPILMLMPSEIALDPGLARPLLDMIEEKRKVNRLFAAVQHIVEWLDGNATPGAMRYYFPAILSLAPGCEALQVNAPSRFVEPVGIAPLLPLIREAAGTVASALLLGNGTSDDLDQPKGMILNFDKETFTAPCGVEIVSPQKAYTLA